MSKGPSKAPWEASDRYVFSGDRCIGVFVVDADRDVTVSNQRWNAIISAAAPDMLAALKLAIRHFNPKTTRTAAAYKAMQLAVEKAEGRRK